MLAGAGHTLNRPTCKNALLSDGSWRWMSEAEKMLSRNSQFFWHSSQASKVLLNRRRALSSLSTSALMPTGTVMPVESKQLQPCQSSDRPGPYLPLD